MASNIKVSVPMFPSAYLLSTLHFSSELLNSTFAQFHDQDRPIRSVYKCSFVNFVLEQKTAGQSCYSSTVGKLTGSGY